MLILNFEQVQSCLPMAEAIEGMKKAFVAISDGSAIVPARGHLDIDSHEGTVLTMPSFVETADERILSIKIATVYQNNHEHDLPTVLASVLALDPETGKPLALIDGTSLTAIRTAAASAAASDVLARQDCRVLAIIGAGVLARTHIEAVCQIRDIEKVLIYSRSREKCEALCEKLSQQLPCQVDVGEIAETTVESADIVCTVTNSSKPVFSAAAIRPGTHLVAVGSHHPEAAEIPVETVARSKIFVDQLKPALMAGDLHQAIAAGAIDKSAIVGEMGNVIRGQIMGRQADDEITFFKSVGNAVEDSFATQIVMNNAVKNKMGLAIDF